MVDEHETLLYLFDGILRVILKQRDLAIVLIYEKNIVLLLKYNGLVRDLAGSF